MKKMLILLTFVLVGCQDRIIKRTRLCSLVQDKEGVVLIQCPDGTNARIEPIVNKETVTEIIYETEIIEVCQNKRDKK